MSAYDRINTAITELPPESAFKVFQLINELFENRLYKELFKQKFWNFDAGEQYYICFYLDYYFNRSERYTFFNKWLEQKEFTYKQAGEEELFHNFKEELLDNKQQLIAILDSYKKTAHRRLEKLKKYKVPFDQYAGYFDRGQINYRVPLFYKPNTFKELFIKAMSEIMSPNQAESFFYNSFEFGTNLPPVKFLYIELDNLTDIKEQIVFIKKHYDKDYLYVIENKLQSYNETLEKAMDGRNNLSDKQKEFYKNIEFNKATGIDFAKIIYNAFPEIRDKATDKDLDTFLTNYGKNLVAR